MKVAWFHQYGGPEVFVYEDAPDPESAPGEAVVRIRATGVNHVDLDIRAGVSRFPISLPHILGTEFSGEAAAIRNGETSLKEGDRVWVTSRLPCYACEYCITGRTNLCLEERSFGRGGTPGSYAELVKVPIASLHPLPDHVSFEQAAATPTAFGTAWHVLINRGDLKPGQTVLIHAAGSGVGSAAIQVARLAGATIFTTASSDEKLQKAGEMGAHHLINYAREGFVQRVLELTRGRGVDVIMEHIGGEVFTKSLQCLKKDGVIVVVGGHGGEVVPFDIIPFFRNEFRLVGARIATMAELRLVMDLVVEGKLKPVIYRTLPLSQAADAHRLLASRDVFGKVLLLP